MFNTDITCVCVEFIQVTKFRSCHNITKCGHWIGELENNPFKRCAYIIFRNVVQ